MSSKFLYVSGDDTVLRKFTEDGILLWEKNTPEQQMINAIDSNVQNVFAVSDNGVVFKLDHDGRIVARQDVSIRIVDLVVDQQVVYICRANYIEAFDSYLQLLWRCDVDQSVQSINCAMHNQSKIIVGCLDDAIVTVDCSDGQIIDYYHVDATQIDSNNATIYGQIDDAVCQINNDQHCVQFDAQLQAFEVDTSTAIYYIADGQYGRVLGNKSWTNQCDQRGSVVDSGTRGSMYYVFANGDRIINCQKYDGQINWSHRDNYNSDVVCFTQGVVGDIDPQRFMYIVDVADNVCKINFESHTNVWSRKQPHVGKVVIDDQSNVYALTQRTPQTLTMFTQNGQFEYTQRVQTIGQDVALFDIDDQLQYAYYVTHDNVVAKVRVQDHQIVWQFTLHSDQVQQFAIDDQHNVYTASLDQTVRKIVDGEQMWSYPDTDCPVNSVALNNDFSAIFCSGQDGSVHKINHNAVNQWTTFDFDHPVTDIQVDQHDQIYCTDGYNIIVYNTNGQQLSHYYSNQYIQMIKFDHKSNIILIGQHDIQLFTNQWDYIWTYVHTNQILDFKYM